MTTGEQHYRITLADALSQYKAKLITATALVYYYIRIKRAEGWKITLYQGPTCSELGIEKSAFYKAIANLSDKSLIDVDKSTGIKILVTPTPQTVELIPQTVESIPQTVETQSPEPITDKEFSNSTNSYQIFINSLSDIQRESFLKFGNKKAAELPKPPTLTNQWIETYFQELKVQWEKQECSNGSTHCGTPNNPNLKNFETWEASTHEGQYHTLMKLGLAKFCENAISAAWYEWAKTRHSEKFVNVPD